MITWSLAPVAACAIVPGLAAMLIGVRIIGQGLTLHPVITGVGFILTGLGGVAALPVYRWRQSVALRSVAAAVAVVAAVIWLMTVLLAYWAHLAVPK